MVNAQSEILILDYNDIQVKRDDYSINEKLREEYFDQLLRKVEEQTNKGTPFIYKRICQFNPPTNSFQILDDPIFINHCLKMTTSESNKGHRVYLKRTAVFYPMTFKIIDRKYLILHITGVNRQGKKLLPFLKGELIIYDPQQELIDVFLKAWEHVENAPETVSVGKKDIS